MFAIREEEGEEQIENFGFGDDLDVGVYEDLSKYTEDNLDVRDAVDNRHDSDSAGEDHGKQGSNERKSG